jgi:mono/diheme cytochrome c family protein
MKEDTRSPRKSTLFFWTIGTLVGIYLFLALAVPYVTMWVTAQQAPVPVPQFAISIYMICAIIGALVYVSSNEERWREFLEPLVSLLLVPDGRGRVIGLGSLAVIPLIVGWVVWEQVVPAAGTPTSGRIQHPTPPIVVSVQTRGQEEAVARPFTELVNPFNVLSAEEQAAVIEEGKVLFQKNCRPCHGSKADGAGPLARGLRLQPADFRDPGTIATVVEGYAFWRVLKGAFDDNHLLQATPWNSAMPAWEQELTEQEIWKIVMAEYVTAEVEPRKPEKLE